MLGQVIWRPIHAGTFDVLEHKRVRAIHAKVMGLQTETMLDEKNKEQDTPELVVYRLIFTWEALASLEKAKPGSRTDLDLHVLANYQ